MKQTALIASACLAWFAGGFAAGAAEPAAGGAALPEPYASADARRGRILFLQCSACHDLGADTVARIGPSLRGLSGRRAGSLPGFAYSEALRASGIVWTPEALDRFIEQPSAVVPGTIMVLAGVARPADRAAIARYVFEQAAVE